MKNTEAAKKEIRRIKLKERAALPPGIRQHAEAGIAQRLFSCALYQAAREIFCYASYGSEADTSRIIAESLRLGKRTAVPKVTGERRMEFYYISSMEELSPGYRGIPEPEGRAGTEAVPARDGEPPRIRWRLLRYISCLSPSGGTGGDRFFRPDR